MAYMEIFGNCSQTQSVAEYSRHSVHTMNISQSTEHHIAHSQTMRYVEDFFNKNVI